MQDPQSSLHHSATPPAWGECVFIGLVAALCAVVGHNIYLCNGIEEGIFFTVILPYMFIFWPPSFLAFVIVMILVAAGVRELPAHSYFSGRLVHLMVCIGVVTLLIANVLSYAFGSGFSCDMGVWN